MGKGSYFKAKLSLSKAYWALLPLLVFSLNLSHAQPASGPSNLNISGTLFLPTGQVVTQSSVNFKVELMDKSATCVLYSEEHLAQNLQQSRGGFSFLLGSGSSKANNLQGGSTFSWQLFYNSGAVAPFTGCAGGLTLASGAERVIRVSYDLGGGYVAMNPEVPVVSAAYAMNADRLQSY